MTEHVLHMPIIQCTRVAWCDVCRAVFTYRRQPLPRSVRKCETMAWWQQTVNRWQLRTHTKRLKLQYNPMMRYCCKLLACKRPSVIDDLLIIIGICQRQCRCGRLIVVVVDARICRRSNSRWPASETMPSRTDCDEREFGASKHYQAAPKTGRTDVVRRVAGGDTGRHRHRATAAGMYWPDAGRLQPLQGSSSSSDGAMQPAQAVAETTLPDHRAIDLCVHNASPARWTQQTTHALVIKVI